MFKAVANRKADLLGLYCTANINLSAFSGVQTELPLVVNGDCVNPDELTLMVFHKGTLPIPCL